MHPQLHSVVADRKAWLPGLALVAAGFWLRVDGVGDAWLNPDEGIYYSTLTWSSLDAFWREVQANAHPPAFYLLLRGIGYLTEDFVVLRGLSVLAGTASIGLLWAVGHELGGRGRTGSIAGAVAAGLLAVNGEAVELSTVIRPYMLLVTLLLASLLALLRYRAEPTPGRLAGHVVFSSLALLTHYAAALAYVAFVLIVSVDMVVSRPDRRGARRLMTAQVVPAAVLCGLFVWHLAGALESPMMRQALAPGGWLSEWLAGSAPDVWRGFLAFQLFHLPPEFMGRSGVLVIASVGACAALGRRTAALLALAGLSVAAAASFGGLYPLGPTRHSVWLVVFTLPVLGVAVASIATTPLMARLAVSACLLAMVAFGTGLERSVGAVDTIQVVADRPAERPLGRGEVNGILRLLSPGADPPLILMSFQPFNTLMPLYSDEREVLLPRSSAELFSFRYGSRLVAVAGSWDWGGLGHVRETVSEVRRRFGEPRGATATVGAARAGRALVIVGGWDSALFDSPSGLASHPAVVEVVTVPTRRAEAPGRPAMAALLIDVPALLDSI